MTPSKCFYYIYSFASTLILNSYMCCSKLTFYFIYFIWQIKTIGKLNLKSPSVLATDAVVRPWLVNNKVDPVKVSEITQKKGSFAFLSLAVARVWALTLCLPLWGRCCYLLCNSKLNYPPKIGSFSSLIFSSRNIQPLSLLTNEKRLIIYICKQSLGKC